MAACCTPTLHGWFQKERLARIGLRHSIDCARTPELIDEIAKGAWWHQGRRVKTGETYR